MAEAAPFPEGDPRNALYNETIANLEHAYQTTLAGDKETLSNAQTNAQYQQGLLTKAEPGTYAANEHRANAGGILESGINAARRGTIASGYAQKRYAVTHGLQETEGKVRRADEGAKYSFEAGQHTAATKALEEGKRALLSERPNEPPAPAAPPAPPSVPSGLPVVVGQRAQPVTGSPRRAAARRVVRK